MRRHLISRILSSGGWRENSTILTAQTRINYDTTSEQSNSKNRHDDMATTSTTIATVYSSEQQDDGAAAWLLSLASGDERACSSPSWQETSCTDGHAIARCAAVIKDADADVYRRGLAVLALGRTLGREIGRSQSEDSVAAIGAFRQVQQYDRWCWDLAVVLVAMHQVFWYTLSSFQIFAKLDTRLVPGIQ